MSLAAAQDLGSTYTPPTFTVDDDITADVYDGDGTGGLRVTVLATRTGDGERITPFW